MRFLAPITLILLLNISLQAEPIEMPLCYEQEKPVKGLHIMNGPEFELRRDELGRPHFTITLVNFYADDLFLQVGEQSFSYDFEGEKPTTAYPEFPDPQQFILLTASTWTENNESECGYKIVPQMDSIGLLTFYPPESWLKHLGDEVTIQFPLHGVRRSDGRPFSAKTRPITMKLIGGDLLTH
ncbi:hypothetical protein [Cerasicoccus maritimus]|uniref:hypothetical protein n=1 Tax=Cerasicoccus maritimus TaxID=490089 RepID=UPI002852DAA4|nr:hypothetical protein [Cerasicoccus maritimus]